MERFNNPKIESVFGNGEYIGSFIYRKILKSKTAGFHNTPVGTIIPNDGTAGGRTWGVDKDPQGNLWYSFVDSGIVVKDNGDGTSTVMINHLMMPTTFDFLPNGDLVVPEMMGMFSLYTKKSGYKTRVDIKGKFPMALSAHVAWDGWVYLCFMGAIHRWNPTTDKQEKVISDKTGFTGDGGDYKKAQINPIDCWLRKDNVLIIADGPNNRLRAINFGSSSVNVFGTQIKPQTIDTFCGSGEVPPKGSPPSAHEKIRGFAGDLGPAKEALIDWPFAPEMDSKGRLYFADADNARVRVIDTDGIIHTLVGGLPMPEYNGYRKWLGVIPSFVLKLGDKNGDGGPAVQADLNQLMDIFVDEKRDGTIDLYIGDTDNCKVRVVKNIRW